MRKLLCAMTLLLAFLLMLGACNEPPSTNEPPANDPSTNQAPTEEQTPPASQTPPAEKSFEELSAKEQAFRLLRCDLLDNSDISSCTMQTATTLSGNTYGYDLTANSQGVLKICNPAGNDLFYVEDTNTTITMTPQAGTPTVITQSVQKGYANGKIFSAYHSNNAENDYAVFSYLSAQEYAEHLERTSSDFSIKSLTESDCAQVSCTKVTEGYKVELASFTAQGLDKLCGMLGSLTDLLGVVITDAHLTMLFGEDMLPRSAQLDFSFGLTASPTQIQIYATYYNYNQTQPFAKDFSDYTQLEDLRSVELVEKALSDVSAAKNLSFDWLSSFNGDLLGTSTQSSAIDIETVNGRYTFTVSETINGSTRVTQYADGVIKQTTNGQLAQQAFTAEQARQWVSTYTKPITPQLSTISAACVQNGTHVLSIQNADPSYFLQLLSGLGVQENDVTATATLSVTLSDNGKLVSLDYALNAQIFIGGTSYNATLHILCNNYSYS